MQSTCYPSIYAGHRSAQWEVVSLFVGSPYKRSHVCLTDRLDSLIDHSLRLQMCFAALRNWSNVWCLVTSARNIYYVVGVAPRLFSWHRDGHRWHGRTVLSLPFDVWPTLRQNHSNGVYSANKWLALVFRCLRVCVRLRRQPCFAVASN